MGWLRKQGDVSLRYGRTDDYVRYVELLTNWGEKHGRTPVEVEEAIFELARDELKAR